MYSSMFIFDYFKVTKHDKRNLVNTNLSVKKWKQKKTAFQQIHTYINQEISK